MRIAIDEGRCQGHARCYDLCPDLFDLDEIGHAVARAETVPDGLEDLARQAVAGCPERAISVE